MLFGARVHKSRRRRLSSLDVGARTCLHMMKMDGVIENRFRVPEKCRGKTPNIGAKRALPLQRALPDLSLSNPGRGNASERGHIITERRERERREKREKIVEREREEREKRTEGERRERRERDRERR